MKPLAVLALATVLVTACMPATTAIYRPEGPGGKLRETMCNYNSGPGIWNAIEFEREGAVVRFLASRTSAHGVSITVTLRLPENTTANILRPTILLTSKEFDKPIEIQTDTYTWYDKQKVVDAAVSEPMIGRSFTERWGKRHISYHLDFVSSISAPESFEITPPVITLNGRSVEIPTIRFSWETAFFIATMNC